MLHRLLDRLFPHDTLHVGGKPYMHRWYVFGYAPTPDDPDARMICATCRGDVVSDGCEPEAWEHLVPPGELHDVVAISAPRSGWRWQDHGLGAFRIHCTVASDDSRAFHDHPWDFASIIVKGAYRELRPLRVVTDDHDGAIVWCPRPDEPGRVVDRVYRAPALNVKRAADLHVLDVERGPVWSLFFTRPKTRSWGFAGPFGWIGWRTFDERFPEREAFTTQG